MLAEPNILHFGAPNLSTMLGSEILLIALEREKIPRSRATINIPVSLNQLLAKIRLGI
jgi:hypothetical protein